MQPRLLALAVFGAAIGIMPAARAVSAEPRQDSVTLGPDLEVHRVRPGYWVHVSRDAQGVPANGMLVRTKDGLVLVDTGWSEDHAQRLLAWARKSFRARVRAAVVTHSHNDRAGGLAALRRRGIDVISLDLTAGKLRQAGATEVPTTLLTPESPVRADPLGFEVFYPGPGHSADNVVVWFPSAGILFGGCLVKAETANDLGNVADADLRNWAKAVQAVRDRYPEAAVVVPGHGAVGTPQALAHTVDLLHARESAAMPGTR